MDLALNVASFVTATIQILCQVPKVHPSGSFDVVLDPHQRNVDFAAKAGMRV